MAVLIGALLLVGAVVPIAAGAAAATVHPGGSVRAGAQAFSPPVAKNGTTNTYSQAWGAVANVSVAESFVGAYNASQSVGGNLTSTGAYIALHEGADMVYAVYAIANVSVTSTGHVYVVLESAEFRAVALAVAASGYFPVAGTYAANATPPLALRNVSMAAAVQTLVVNAAFLNLTAGPNGSLSLDNEHVESVQALNISLVAVQFPNITALPGGGESVSYTTGAVHAAGYVAQSWTASFSPAIPLVLGPLFVGKNWTANSTATVHGWSAYAETIAAVSGGQSASFSRSGAASLNTTQTLALSFSVTGTRTVYLPDGTTETDYVISYSGTNGQGNVVVASGLIVLPGTPPSAAAGTPPPLPGQPATVSAAPGGSHGGAILYSPHQSMVDGEQARPTGNSVVTATPMSTDSARAGMRGLSPASLPAARGTAPSPLVGALAAYLVVGAVAAVGVAIVTRRGGPRPKA